MSHLPVISRYTFSADLPRPYHFAFLSDLHGCDNQPLLQALNRIQPQTVLIGGDFIHDYLRYQEGFDFLSACSRRFPVYCSIGNHELLYGGDLAAAVQKTGAVLLDNTAVSWDGLSIGGLTSPLKEQRTLSYFTKKQVPDLDFLDSFSQFPGYKILLCHHPEFYDPYLKNCSLDLILAGHAHGGQWRIGRQGIFAPGQGLFPKYTSGLYDGRLLVSRGLGNATRIPRIHNQPEILDLYLLPR